MLGSGERIRLERRFLDDLKPRFKLCFGLSLWERFNEVVLFLDGIPICFDPNPSMKDEAVGRRVKDSS